ncbi:MAG: hypothetical protein KKB20_06240 [Proteobacteria bacterium]|nr:hypothetical protein [Pseudomonadota bacterium]
MEQGGTEVGLDTYLVGQAGLEGADGRYSMTRWRVSATHSHFTLGYTHRTFQWEDIGRLPFGNGRDDPWKDLHTVGLKAKYTGSISGPWRYYFSGEASSSFEDRVGSPSLDVLAAFGYNFSPRFKVRVGAAVLYHEVRVIAVPVAALKWWGGGKSAEEPLVSVSVGLPESTLTYHCSPELSFTASLLADSKVFRLSEHSPVFSEGFAETRDIITCLMVNYSPLPGLVLSGGLGYDFFRQMQLYDRHGDKQADYDVEGAWTGRLLIAYQF